MGALTSRLGTVAPVTGMYQAQRQPSGQASTLAVKGGVC